MEHRWARRLLGLFGWRVDVVPPPEPRCVIVVYPHTSNWDFLVGYLAKLAVGLEVEWVGKDALFRPPLARSCAGWAASPSTAASRRGSWGSSSAS